MDNVEEGEPYVTKSQVRTGHFREFQFALKTQNELCGSLSRARVRKSRFSQFSELRELKKVKGRIKECEDDQKSVVMDMMSDEEGNKVHIVESQKRESGLVNVNGSANGGENENGTAVLKEKKKVPTKLRELLETGLLEGLSVKYIRKKAATGNGLAGIIRGCGLLCFCDKCKGNQVVTPNSFEYHAGSSNKRPSDYIYLENGKNLRDILEVCKNANSNNIEPTIRNAISSSTEKELAFCVECKVPISDVGFGRGILLCNSCLGSKPCQTNTTPITETGERSSAQVTIRKPSNSASKSSLQSSKSQGRVTLKDLRLHKLVFQDDILPDGTELGYYVHGRKVMSGHKQGSGIFCYCCKSEVSPSQFEAHAGYPSRRKPYLHIYTSNGVSLHELSLTLSRTSEFSTDQNDDLCTVCHDPGDLLCCDGCPRAFHTGCVNLSKVPQNKWYCKYCEDNFEKEKFAHCNPNAIAAGRVPGVDPIEQITNRCIRIVKIDTQDSGGCAICRVQDFCKTGFGPRTVIICDQCEKEYHVGCMREHNMEDLKELPVGDWFCCSTCERINASLKELINEGVKKLPSHLAEIIKKKDAEKDSCEADIDLTWRVVNGRKSCFDDIRTILAKTVSVFHEQFSPIPYGELNQDLIPHMVYGRNLKEKELGGMCCAVIIVNSIIVSCAVFRVFGAEIVEIPLVATSKESQGKGFFQCLYYCMEKLFEDLGVENILLPAADETRSLWMNKFGFSEVSQEKFDDFKKRYAVMTFDGTSMLHKLVPKSQT